MENENGTSLDGMENSKMTAKAYVSYCKSVLAHAQSGGMELGQESVESYSVGQLSWQAGELPKRLRSKNLLSLFDDDSSSSGGGGDGCPAKTIYITLRGEDSSQPE